MPVLIENTMGRKYECGSCRRAYSSLVSDNHKFFLSRGFAHYETIIFLIELFLIGMFVLMHIYLNKLITRWCIIKTFILETWNVIPSYQCKTLTPHSVGKFGCVPAMLLLWSKSGFSNCTLVLTRVSWELDVVPWEIKGVGEFRHSQCSLTTVLPLVGSGRICLKNINCFHNLKKLENPCAKSHVVFNESMMLFTMFGIQLIWHKDRQILVFSFFDFSWKIKKSIILRYLILPIFYC